ncbi:MAG: extracellular solute-binding protein [Lachnospiraceae bacterium]|nr:extracellular solute-binding protein [Lachnospiraceae bacterium]
MIRKTGILLLFVLILFTLFSCSKNEAGITQADSSRADNALVDNAGADTALVDTAGADDAQTDNAKADIGQTDNAGADNDIAQRNETGKNNKDEISDIVIWTWDETFNVKAARLAAEKYKATHPDINIVVEAMEREEILTETKNIISAGLYDKLPDIVMIEDYDVSDILNNYQEEFTDLTDSIDTDKYVDYKAKLCSRNGRMYGIPFDSGTAAFFYRSDILEEAGYSSPALIDMTWDEFEKMSRDVYEKTGKALITLDPTDMPMIRIMMQSCGKWYVKNDGYTPDIYENKALRHALEVYRNLIANGGAKSVNGWNEFISAFQNGEVAGIVTGCWIISNIKAVPEQSGLWRIARIPVFDDVEECVPASNVGGSSWYVLKHSKNSEKAKQFAVEMFALDDDLTDTLIEEIGLIPAVKDPTIYSRYEAKDPFFQDQKVTKLLSELADEIPAVNYGRRTYEIEDIVEEEFQGAIESGDYEDCLKRAEIKAGAISK